MNIRRRTKNIIAALFAMVLCLTGFLPLSGMQTVRAEEKEAKIWFKDSEDNADSGKATFVSDKGGIVYASVEKFTVGQGYLIEPTEVSFEAGETYADIIEKLLKANGYTYDAQNTGMGFYLAEIDHADSGVLNIPQCISNMSEDAPTNDKHKSNPYKDTQGLGEFSYSNYSGWYYFVNNENPGLGMGGVKASDGDVVRYQFTLYGLGADLGDKPNDQTGGIKALELPNKDSVTKNLALMRQILAKDDKADPEGIYKNVLKIVTNMDSTKEQFAQAEQEGWGFKADTLSGIAEHFGLKNLEKTVARYNEMCRNGEDTEHFKSPMFMREIKEGKGYYAFEYAGSYWCTLGGVKTDAKLRVLDVNKKPITGVYAGGAEMGSAFGDTYYDICATCAGLSVASGVVAANSIMSYER